MSRLFRRRPVPQPPDVLAVYLDDLAMAYTRTPGLVTDLLTAHADALFHEDVEFATARIEGRSVDAASAEAATLADHTRADLFAVSRTAVRWTRKADRREVTS